MTNATTTRTVILSVTDTRDHEHGHCGKPIPGTGDVIPCECCRRPIAIHVEVVDVDVVEIPTPSGWSRFHYTGSRNRRLIGKTCAKRAGYRFAAPSRKCEGVLVPSSRDWF